MTKLLQPLFSFNAEGKLSKALTFCRQAGQNLVKTIAHPVNQRTFSQLTWRHMYQKSVALWKALTPSEKAQWESIARPHHMTGFAYFVSQALKPNPGLYLPLQGGIMQGDIDMNGNKIIGLPTPAVDSASTPKSYVDTAISTAITASTARVTRSNVQSIPSGSWTAMNFDTESYDTEGYWQVGSPSRLTVPQAGKYLVIARGGFQAQGTGNRALAILKNAVTFVADDFRANLGAASAMTIILTSMLLLAASDYLQCIYYQESGGNLNTLAGTDNPEFSILRLK